MEEAKRQRQAASGEATGEEDGLTKEEVQLRNDRKRFENLLENSLLEGGDMGNNYLTLQQEEEAAEAVCEEWRMFTLCLFHWHVLTYHLLKTVTTMIKTTNRMHPYKNIRQGNLSPLRRRSSTHRTILRPPLRTHRRTPLPIRHLQNFISRLRSDNHRSSSQIVRTAKRHAKALQRRSGRRDCKKVHRHKFGWGGRE